MKKNFVLRTAVLTAALTASFGMTAFAAGHWEKDAAGYWWQEEDGSYPVSCWKWLDGNNDGIAESYYFDASGYMAADTTVDGYTVNADGAWVENGAVQTRQTEAQVPAAPAGQSQESSSAALNPGTYRYHKTMIYRDGSLCLDGSVYDGSTDSYNLTFNERGKYGLYADYMDVGEVKDVSESGFTIDDGIWPCKYVKSGDRWYQEGNQTDDYYYVTEDADTITYYNAYEYRWEFSSEDDMTMYPYLEVCTYKRVQ